MDTTTPRKTHAQIIHRVPKTDTNIYGITPAKTIPINVPCIVAFGGENTQAPRSANYYASLLKRLIDFYGVTGVEVYSAYYYEQEQSLNINAITTNPEQPVNSDDTQYVTETFKCADRPQERANAFARARSKIINSDTKMYNVDTNYIQELYDIVIRPRIATISGHKMLDSAALQNVRNVIFFTHSHGSVPVRAFQDIMQRDMQALGYDAAAIRQIMKNILVIQHAPMSPLERPKFNTFSFMSADDTQMDFHNKFSEYVAEHSADLPASYFALGQFFAAYRFTYDNLAEHQIVGLLPNKEQDMLTPDGATIMATERNFIINGLRAAVHGKPITTPEKLIAPISKTDPVRPDFKILAQNGEFFMNVMQKDLRESKSNGR